MPKGSSYPTALPHDDDDSVALGVDNVSGKTRRFRWSTVFTYVRDKLGSAAQADVGDFTSAATGATIADVAAGAAAAADAAQSDVDTHEAATGAAVHGLGTASTHPAGDFATAAAATSAQAAADAAQADVDGHEAATGAAVHGLGTASTHATGDFATPASVTTAQAAADAAQADIDGHEAASSGAHAASAISAAAHGSTGSTTVQGQLDELTDEKQAVDPTLTALAGLATGANKLPYSTGADTFSQADLTAFARTVLDDADAATVRGTIGVGTAGTLASDTDGTLAANTDANVATQKATKTYADTKTKFGTTTTVADADTAIGSGARRVLVTSLTATRTMTLPAANALAAGETIEFIDLSGSVTFGTASSDKLINVTRAGADTIVNGHLPNRSTTTASIFRGWGVLELMSDGTSKWVVTHSDTPGSQDYWVSFNNDLNIANNVWTPIYFKTLAVNIAGTAPTRPTQTTTIAAGSNAAALPQATINVASTTGFTATGFAVITIGGVDTIFAYTGVTSTSFTGCNTGVNAGIATGTMATGNVVTQVVVGVTNGNTDAPGLNAWVLQAAFAAAAAGYGGIRYRAIDGVFNFEIFANTRPLINTTTLPMQAAGQAYQQALVTGASYNPLLNTRVEVIQTSGAALLCKNSSIDTPQLLGGQPGG